MVLSEQQLRNRLARAKGGHKKRIQAKLDKVAGSTPAVVEAVTPPKAPAKRKKAAKKKD